MSAALTATVAAEVRAEMGRQGWTHQHIADAIDRNRQYAARRINGDLPWDVAELEKIAAALRVPLAQFLPAAALSTPR